ncbi:uncharacterized protein RCC_01697 [Ramularia collo-cygni]|uniref:F-box domain-containing protein n=1 Tax=Ramularia collo-cygni TaxID=112498 RepID=A0A2D3USZ4_9PEZI|nr:uncharacterized protein RCC_01697 [Ramularia collo-cygni]CZT15860.1 uncharacterized protein RCC_01697 [Ramularia collo-cygni]
MNSSDMNSGDMNSSDTGKTVPTTQPPPFRLSDLPTELQLIIFEYAVSTDENLLVNLPCASYYGTFPDDNCTVEEMLKVQALQSPQQPALTRTCQSIRSVTIPMFYKLNNFGSCYCYKDFMQLACGWLRAIGWKNRAMMKSFTFFSNDDGMGGTYPYLYRLVDDKDLKALLRSTACRDMGGMIVSTYSVGNCAHAVKFPLEEEDPMDGLELDLLFGSTADEGVTG